MSDTAALPNRTKRGVGLSGVTAGNTALVPARSNFGARRAP